MDFYDIALAKFLQSFPDLSNFIVTFKDLTEELSNSSEGSEIAIGCFIIKAGNNYFYIPVIAKGSNVYPIDSMFSVEKQKFLPLTQKTVVEIINSNSFGLGTKTKVPPTVPGNPSVYDLINPPRTGKFVYASSSRLSEFLHLIPNEVKDFVKGKIVENKKLYNGLNSMFGLKEVLGPLSAPSTNVTAIPTTPSISVVTEGSGLTPDEIKQIISVGYVVKGQNPTNRIAIAAEDFNRSGRFSQAGCLEKNREYDFVTQEGSIKTGFVPETISIGRALGGQTDSLGMSNAGSNLNFTLFGNGDYAYSSNHVIQGNPRDGNDIVNKLFEFRPPVMLKNLEGGETFALFSPDMKLIGVYRGMESPVRNTEGLLIKRLTDLTTHSPVNLFAYRNIRNYIQEEKELFVPYDVLVVLLSRDVSHDLEINVNSAQRKRSLNELLTLGAAMDIGFDGVEFAVNGKSAGAEAGLMERLVVGEGIDPSVAHSFVKKAMEQRHVKIYLSKQASDQPGEIPQYGEAPPQQQDDQLVNGKKGKTPLLGDEAIPNIEGTLGLEDPQTTEASVLTELLQAPDMYQYIEEYMPDIEEAIDKLGRTLFLLRINLDKFSQGNNPTEVFGFVNQLRNVYRMLGDNFIKLQQILNMNLNNDNGTGQKTQ